MVQALRRRHPLWRLALCVAGLMSFCLPALAQTVYVDDNTCPATGTGSVAIGVGAFATVRVLKRYAPKAPGALVALILMTVVVAILDLDKKGVSVLGTLPSGLPTLTVPDIPLGDYLKLLPGAVAIVGITLAEALLLALPHFAIKVIQSKK